MLGSVAYLRFYHLYSYFGTNLLFLVGVNVPWTELPPVRPGEALARFPGFKGNALYSGSITFVSACYMLNQKKVNKLVFYIRTCVDGRQPYLVWFVSLSYHRCGRCNDVIICVCIEVRL